MPGVPSCFFDQMKQDPSDRPGLDVVGKPWHALRDWHGLVQIGDACDDRLGLRGHLGIAIDHVGESLIGGESEVNPKVKMD